MVEVKLTFGECVMDSDECSEAFFECVVAFGECVMVFCGFEMASY